MLGRPDLPEARFGTLTPPELPRVLAGTEQAVSASLSLPLAAVRYVERDEEDEKDENAFVSERGQTSMRGEDKP